MWKYIACSKRADASTEGIGFSTSEGRKMTKESKSTIPDELKIARELAEKASMQLPDQERRTTMASRVCTDSSYVPVNQSSSIVCIIASSTNNDASNSVCPGATISSARKRLWIYMLVFSLLITGAGDTELVLGHEFNTTYFCPAHLHHQFKSPLKTNWLGEQYAEQGYTKTDSHEKVNNNTCPKLSADVVYASVVGFGASCVANLGPLTLVRNIAEVTEFNRILFGVSSISLATSFSAWAVYLFLDPCRDLFSIVSVGFGYFFHTGYWIFLFQPSLGPSFATYLALLLSSLIFGIMGRIKVLVVVSGIVFTLVGHCIRVYLAPDHYDSMVLIIAIFGIFGSGSFIYKAHWSIHIWYKIGCLIALAARTFDISFQIYYLCTREREVPVRGNHQGGNQLASDESVDNIDEEVDSS